jgi:ATP phosphoribosyltransferase
MSALVIAVPAKGRLQENAEAFFARAGLKLVQPRGVREYRGSIEGYDGIEVAYLSAAEITQQLGQGAVHFGITGEDLVREMIPDRRHQSRADRRPRLRSRQRRGRGTASLDRRA